MKIDNYALTMYQKCPALYQLRHILRWQPRALSAALGYGKVIHSGLETWYSNIDLPNSERLELAKQTILDKWPDNQPTDDFRNADKARELLERYSKEYPQETWKPLLIEVPFAYELGRWILHCKNCFRWNVPFNLEGAARNECATCMASLEPIEYGGIFDMLVEFNPGKYGTLYVLDHKTTSQLGKMFFHQFFISNQITGYVWGAQQASGRKVGGAIINALCTTIGGKISFDRSMTNRSEQDIEVWKDDVAATCNRIRMSELTGHWERHTDQCMGKYGLCAYHNVHILSDPAEQAQRLATDYIQDTWDFENRNDD